MEGNTRCFPVERDGFDGIFIPHIIARIIQHSANFLLARGQNMRVPRGRETINLHERALISRGKGKDIEGIDG